MSVNKFVVSTEEGGVSKTKKAEFISNFGLELQPDSEGEYYLSEEFGPMYMGEDGDFQVLHGLEMRDPGARVAELFAPFLEDGSVLIVEEVEENFSYRLTFKEGKVHVEDSMLVWVRSRVVHEY
jgi:hypothetical protein